jgi:hypothetical protein
MNSLYTPVFQGFSGATGYNPADLMGAQQASFQSGMDKTNASNAKKGNTLNAGATVGAAALSDATLKHDIQPLSGAEALEALLQLGGVTWRWNSDGSADMGVIAQDVQRILPELINSDLDHLRVNYTGLVALAIESIKYIVEKTK